VLAFGARLTFAGPAVQQIHRQFRKPLVVFSPKNLLRHPAAKSNLNEFDDIPDDQGIVGVRFKRLIMDEKATDRCVL
jgi:2-oxoglutarate dehydrogenase E1 component